MMEDDEDLFTEIGYDSEPTKPPTVQQQAAHTLLIEYEWGYKTAPEKARGPFAWAAIDICARHGVEHPQWVNDYLAESARAMMAANRQCEAAAGNVADYLSLNGSEGSGQGAFASLQAKRKKQAIAFRFAHLVVLYDYTPPQARSVILEELTPTDGSESPSVDTVHRAIRDVLTPPKGMTGAAAWRRHIGELCTAQPGFEGAILCATSIT